MNYKLQEFFEKRWVRITGIVILIILLLLSLWLGFSNRSKIAAVKKTNLRQDSTLIEHGLLLDEHSSNLSYVDSVHMADMEGVNVKLDSMDSRIIAGFKKLEKKSGGSPITYYNTYTTVQQPVTPVTPVTVTQPDNSAVYNYNSTNNTNISNEEEYYEDEEVIEDEEFIEEE
jgi:hypothetical protein